MSQTKVNDHTYQWPGGDEDAKIIFQRLAEAGVDFLHVTSRHAWQPAFKNSQPLTVLAKRFTDVPVVANGGLHDPTRAEQAVGFGASMISLGRGALANPDFPQILRRQQSLEDFDPAMLRPTATLASEAQWRQTAR